MRRPARLPESASVERCFSIPPRSSSSSGILPVSFPTTRDPPSAATLPKITEGTIRRLQINVGFIGRCVAITVRVPGRRGRGWQVILGGVARARRALSSLGRGGGAAARLTRHPHQVVPTPGVFPTNPRNCAPLFAFADDMKTRLGS